MTPRALAPVAVAALSLAAGLAAGCGAAPARLAEIDRLESVRASAPAQQTAQLAPEVHARAEQERDAALRAHAAGDDVAAALHAERAIAAYEHALVVARAARAEAELADARKSLDAAGVQEQSVEASRAELERQAAELEARVQVARERLLPARSAAVTGEREAARLSAARSLAVEARLLCSAARLVAADAPAPAPLAAAEAEVAALEQRLAKDVRPAPIDDASRARTACLDALTRARRARGGDTGGADALLSELSASGGWDPARDERGVVVTLRGVFRGAQLAEGGASKLNELGRVAAAHPGVGVEVVVHDARPASAKDDDARRGDAAVQALVAGGAPASRVKLELAGARAPVADPSDAKVRDRNERLEVVFVAP